MLCQYKDLFGVPGEGVHKWRIPGTDAAGIDVLLSIGLVWIVATKIRIEIAFIIVFGVALVMHLLFCVK
jgi:hypothetical protein